MKNNNKKKLISKLTLILSTNNSRDQLIFRFLDYYNSIYGNYKLKIIISDDGSKKGYITLKKKIDRKNYNLDITILNYFMYLVFTDLFNGMLYLLVYIVILF